MTSGPLSIAVAQPPTTSYDVDGNALAHAAAIREAAARVVVFPELSLTGYELDAPVVALDHPALSEIVEACRAADAVAFIGAPVAEAGREYIAMLRVDAGGVRVVYRKAWLHGGESQRFTPGPRAEVTDVDGWRLGLAICRDTGVSQHTAALARAGIDAYIAGVLDVPGEEAERHARSFLTARALSAPVAIASYAGGTGLYPETSGGSSVYDREGALLASVSPEAGNLARAVLQPR